MNKIIIASAAKLHAFSLAEQLQRANRLNAFFTTYAYQKNTILRKFVRRVDKEDIPPDKIYTFLVSAIGRKLFDWPWFWNELFDQWVAYNLKIRDDYEVFIGWSGMCFKSLVAAKSMGKKTIVTRGSAHIIAQNELLQSEYKRRGINYSIDRQTIEKELAEYEIADYITVLSQFAANTFIDKGVPENKIIINPLGVDVKLFHPSFKNVQNAKFRLVYLGHLSFRKGIPYLIEAVEELNKKYSFELLLIGGNVPEIERWMKSYPLPKNCSLLGHIPHYQLPVLLNSCDIGIIPSVEDGFAQVIPQLLSSGVPVITTTNTAGPDIIKNGYNGYIIPIQSTTAIIDSLALLFDNPVLLTQLKMNTRSFNKSGFTWDDYGNRYNLFIDNIINK